MASLLETAIAAHGGLAAWTRFQRLQVDLSITGVIWDFKQRPGLLTGVRFDLATKKQRVVISPFSGPERRSVWVPERQVFETLDGAVVETRANYPSAYREFQGIKVPTARRIYAYDANGQKVAQPLLVAIDIDKVEFS